MTERVVHWSDWAGQPDIRIACDQTYEGAAWTQPDDLPEAVHARDDDKLYTFETTRVSCRHCLDVIEERKRVLGADFVG